MKVQAYRIVKSKLAKSAFEGEGSRRYGGRWNSPGSTVVYTSSSISLAMLEMLVHLQVHDLIDSYVVIPITFDEKLVSQISSRTLPKDWRVSPAPPEVQQVGDNWIADSTSAVLRVPSAVVGNEVNYLLNPNHPKFRNIDVGKKQPVKFDPRLK